MIFRALRSPEQHQSIPGATDQSGVRAGGSKGEADAGSHLDNPRAELQRGPFVSGGSDARPG
jgi:hypothetical protein